MWNEQRKQLGAIEAGSKNIIEFKYSGEIDLDIKSITSPCSCTEITWNSGTKTMMVTYVPKAVPRHIKEDLKQTSYNDYKSITFSATINNVIKPFEFIILAQVFDNLPKKAKL
jgi:hypothetical protein